MKRKSEHKTNICIEAENIHLSFKTESGAVDVLKGSSFSLKASEQLSIVGPSGSGKTSLLMILAGLQKPTSGRVHLCGQDITDMDEDALAGFRRENIGIVFQSFHLIQTMTALENVAIPLEFSNQKDAFARAEEALTSVGLDHRLLHYPGQLSGGEQQRVALARALVTRPKILLADEPTGNLDSETGEKVIELLFSLSKNFETSLVLVTHDKALAKRCARQAEMHNGQLSL